MKIPPKRPPPPNCDWEEMLQHAPLREASPELEEKFRSMSRALYRSRNVSTNPTPLPKWRAWLRPEWAWGGTGAAALLVLFILVGMPPRPMVPDLPANNSLLLLVEVLEDPFVLDDILQKGNALFDKESLEALSFFINESHL